MELIGTIALAVLAIIGAATSRQLSDEFKAWSPWIVRRIIQRAVRQLPEDQRDRFAEEWQAHVNEIPGDFGKLVTAFGFLSASRKISSNLVESSFKRVLDIVFGVTALIYFVPLFVVAATAIKLDSAGPVFFRQARYGHNGKTVKVFKFRTMTILEDGADFRQVKRLDNRLTPVGRFLGRTHFDELPQLINVVMGEMSMVGWVKKVVKKNRTWAVLLIRKRGEFLGYVEAPDRKAAEAAAADRFNLTDEQRGRLFIQERA